MTTRSQTDSLLVHLVLPCPSCEEPVDAVVDTVKHHARWCCVSCQVFGSAPFQLEIPPPPSLRTPVATA